MNGLAVTAFKTLEDKGRDGGGGGGSVNGGVVLNPLPLLLLLLKYLWLLVLLWKTLLLVDFEKWLWPLLFKWMCWWWWLLDVLLWSKGVTAAAAVVDAVVFAADREATAAVKRCCSFSLGALICVIKQVSTLMRRWSMSPNFLNISFWFCTMSAWLANMSSSWFCTLSMRPDGGVVTLTLGGRSGVGNGNEDDEVPLLLVVMVVMGAVFCCVL